MAATANQLTHEKANANANARIKVLTDLVQSLLKAMEGQTPGMEELKREHANWADPDIKGRGSGADTNPVCQRTTISKYITIVCGGRPHAAEQSAK
jgi:hypothetical protein